MIRSLRWRFSLTYFSITAIFLAVLGLYLMNTMVKYSQNLTEEKLVSSARLIGDNIVSFIETKEEREVTTYMLKAKQITGTKATFIYPNGMVLGDSNDDKQNITAQPEIVKALNGATGRDIRYSKMLKEDYLYIAVPVKNANGVLGVIRLSVPWGEVQSGIWHIRVIIASAVFVVFVLTLLISSSISKEITAPMKEMTKVAKEMAEGILDNYVEIESDDEIGALGRGFNYMARRLNDTIYQITEEKNKIQAILTSMTEGVIAVDSNNRVLLINPAVEKIFGVKAKDIIGGQVLEAIRNYELEKILEKAMKKGSNINQEVEILPYGRTFRVTVAPLKKEEETVGVVAVLRDITEIRELENMRSEFVANVSHELRTPLTSIKGFVETLIDGAVDDKEVAMRFLHIINLEADRLSRLINDILSLSSIEANQKEIHKTTVDIGEVIKKVISMLSPQAKDKNISIDSNIKPGLPVIFANEDMIRQLLINLIDNALKYTPEGGTVTIAAKQSLSGVKVSVKDTGIGIPVDSMTRLFERFYRVDKARSRQMGGTGLGLAIVKHVLEAHGGTIKAESKVGKGSKFTFYIPSKF